MASRPTIALIYSYNENWIGGTYYIENLVAALDTLNEADKPLLRIHTKDATKFPTRTITYPFLEFVPLQTSTAALSPAKRILNQVSRIFSKYYRYANPTVLEHDRSDLVFPAEPGFFNTTGKKSVYWIPDLQEQFMPEFFSEQQVRERSQLHYFLSKSDCSVIFSSEDARNAYQRFFRKDKGRQYVLNFAVTLPSVAHLDARSVLKKFGITHKYFLISNQFWKHKNHITVLEAINKLTLEGDLDVEFVFTGKEHDFRNPDHVASLKAFIGLHGLEKQVKLLGFIGRDEQLVLMKNCLAVIQPSLFEGWSTVVEDCKALSKLVLASDIAVHREQVKENVLFFEPLNADALCVSIKQVISGKVQEKHMDYTGRVRAFATNFMKIVQQELSS